MTDSIMPTCNICKKKVGTIDQLTRFQGKPAHIKCETVALLLLEAASEGPKTAQELHRDVNVMYKARVGTGNID
jgi:hypothetical protein